MTRKDLLSITPEMHAYIEKRAAMPRRQLKDELNREFGLSLSYEQVRGYCKRNKIMTGRDGRFYEGQAKIPGSGAKGPSKTSFVKGQKPYNYAPIGSLRTHSEGYHQVKVTETGYPPRDWVFVHRLLWEEHNGPIPPGHKVLFIDGNPDNITIENLTMVSNGELAVINKRQYRSVIPEARLAAINLGRLIHRIAQRSKAANQ